jgi:predicted transposase/invertase (TIGR01784 family)
MSEINENTTAVDPVLLAVPEIREAIELSEQSAYNAAELDAYDAYWDAVSTEKTLLSDRYEKGLVEGQKKGKAEGQTESKSEIAKKMLIKGMAVSLISELTGLTAVEIGALKIDQEK